jgi:hypothetical protein
VECAEKSRLPLAPGREHIQVNIDLINDVKNACIIFSRSQQRNAPKLKILEATRISPTVNCQILFEPRPVTHRENLMSAQSAVFYIGSQRDVN